MAREVEWQVTFTAKNEVGVNHTEMDDRIFKISLSRSVATSGFKLR